MFEIATSLMNMPMKGIQQMNKMFTAEQSDDAGYDGSEGAGRDKIKSMLGQMSKMKPVVSNLVRSAADPNSVMEAFYDFGKRPGDALPLFWNPTAPVTSMGELRNKSKVFFLVLAVGDKLNIPQEGPLDLRALVDKAYALGDFEALWAVEGLGHTYGDGYFERGIEPEGILFQENTGYLPEKSMTMLNAGIGMAFADNLLKKANMDSPYSEIRSLVQEVINLCRNNAREGFVGAALESLGLITNNFHPGLHEIVDRALLEDHPDVRPYFWHGTGRGSYFQFRNWLPYSLPHLFETATRRARDDESLLNAFAGIAWGLLMVNLRAPEVMANLVIKAAGKNINWSKGFSNGIASAIIMRSDTTPDAPFISAYTDYKARGDTLFEENWQNLVVTPYERGSRDYHPILREKKRLGDVFAYHDLEILAED